jgi:hypothetical protein
MAFIFINKFVMLLLTLFVKGFLYNFLLCCYFSLIYFFLVSRKLGKIKYNLNIKDLQFFFYSNFLFFRDYNKGSISLLNVAKSIFLFVFFYRYVAILYFFFEVMFLEFISMLSRDFFRFLYFPFFCVSYFNSALLACRYSVLSKAFIGLYNFKLVEIYGEDLNIFDFYIEFFNYLLKTNVKVYPGYSLNLFFFIDLKSFFYFGLSTNIILSFFYNKFLILSLFFCYDFILSFMCPDNSKIPFSMDYLSTMRPFLSYIRHFILMEFLVAFLFSKFIFFYPVSYKPIIIRSSFSDYNYSLKLIFFLLNFFSFSFVKQKVFHFFYFSYFFIFIFFTYLGTHRLFRERHWSFLDCFEFMNKLGSLNSEYIEHILFKFAFANSFRFFNFFFSSFSYLRSSLFFSFFFAFNCWSHRFFSHRLFYFFIPCDNLVFSHIILSFLYVVEYSIFYVYYFSLRFLMEALRFVFHSLVYSFFFWAIIFQVLALF